MKSVFVLIFLLAVVASGWCQTPTAGGVKAEPKKKVSPLAEYSGEWASTFNGRVWLRLQLELRGDELIGALLHARNIDLNDNGEIKSVSEEQSGGTIREAVLNPDGLLLTVKDAGSQEIDRYTMRLILPSKEEADFKMIGQSMPPGMAKPKPWRLVKSRISPAKSSPPAH
jgi:hypothetical protein